MPEAELLDSTRLRALAGSLISSQIIYFPVRHHSPACSWRLRELIRTCAPRAILVEGPSAFSPLIPLIVDDRTQAPFAVYTYCVVKEASGEVHHSGESCANDSRHAAYYPFCDYSPELVALREGKRIGADLRFIDVDYAVRCRKECDEDGAPRPSLLDERHFKYSRFLQMLAERNGCRNHDELWDHLFEANCRSTDLTEFIARITAYCQLARCDTPTEELDRDGTLTREREMAWHIRTTLDSDRTRNGPVLVVTGGFHTLTVMQMVAAGVQRPQINLEHIKDQHSALIRYSFDRLDRLNGYAAGMPAPAWYQAAWEQTDAKRISRQGWDAAVLQDTAMQVLSDVTERLRKTGTVAPVSTANVIDAYEHALRLAKLRSRPGPTRQDVFDAILSCFVKGSADAEGAQILAIARQVFTGSAMGNVPSGAGFPPLVRDFQQRARRQRLKIDDSLPHRLDLNLYRRVEHRVTSRLLHGMELLNISFANRTGGPDFVKGRELDRLHELWQYEYSPATEAGLIEAAVYGATVPEAVAAKFVETIQQLELKGCARNAALTVTYLVRACVLGLHEQVGLLQDWLAMSLAEDSDFSSLCTASTQLLLLCESREPLEARGLDHAEILLAAAYRRACFLVQDLAACPEAAQVNTVNALLSLHELLLGTRKEKFDASLFWDGLRRLLQREPVPPMIVGAAHGLLHGAELIDAAHIIARARGEFQGREQPREAIAYLRGLLQTAREVCWQMPELLQLLDDNLKTWSDDQFLRALPELRLAFAEMTPHETDRIAALVAETHGAASLGPLAAYDVSAEQLNAGLSLSGSVREALTSERLHRWLGI